MPTGKQTLITRARKIVEKMTPVFAERGKQLVVVGMSCDSKAYGQLLSLLTDLDGRGGEPDPSKRAKYGLQPKRPSTRRKR